MDPLSNPDESTSTTNPPRPLSLPRPDPLAEDTTLEFALPPLRPIKRGAPPPPPSRELFESRLGRAVAGPHRRPWEALLPVVAAGLLMAVAGVGLTYVGGGLGQWRGVGDGRTVIPAADAAPPSPGGPGRDPRPARSLPAWSPQGRPGSPESSAGPPGVGERVHTTPAVSGPIGSAAPALDLPATVPFGQSFSLRATGFPCGGGAQLTVVLSQSGLDSVVSTTSGTDDHGSATITIAVGAIGGVPGQVALANSPGHLTLSPGVWTVRVVNAEQPGCTAAAMASATVTVA